jgi:ubiquinone/menaquinone biosynthesis C-methylase UbiE
MPRLGGTIRGPCPYKYRWLLSNPVRRLFHPLDKTLDAFGLPPGGRVLELGAGSGYFSVGEARRLAPDGRLLCLDLQPEMARYLRQRLDEGGVRNVDVIVGDAMNLPLEADSLDAAFLVTVFGELPDRRRALAELWRVLREGGVLSITESLPDPHYQREGNVRSECEAGGFRFLRVVRRPLGFTLNFAAVKATGSAGSVPTRSP